MLIWIYPNEYIGGMDASSLIKQARKSAGLTQAQLAHAAGTSQPTLSAYESGAKHPSVLTLNRIIRASGASLHVKLREAPIARRELLAELRTHADEIRAAARRRKIRNIRVFGSTARGDESSTSDVDLLVDFDAAKRVRDTDVGISRVERVCC